MLKIDAHQHFWIYDEVRDSWITADMAVLRADFMPPKLLPELQQNHFDGCVVVQSDQSQAENLFQLKNAEVHDFVKGVVGWVDLRAEDIDDQLSAMSELRQAEGLQAYSAG